MTQRPQVRGDVHFVTTSTDDSWEKICDTFSPDLRISLSTHDPSFRPKALTIRYAVNSMDLTSGRDQDEYEDKNVWKRGPLESAGCNASTWWSRSESSRLSKPAPWFQSTCRWHNPQVGWFIWTRISRTSRGFCHLTPL